MERMDEFRRRQGEGAASILAAFDGLTTGRRGLVEAQRRATQLALATGGGARPRERAAVAAVRSAFSAHETEVRAKAREVLAAVAGMSDNWKEHEDLWDDLGPENLRVVEDAHSSWSRLREACRSAERGDREFQASLRDFASLGPDAAAVSEGLIGALDAIISASGETSALADEYLTVLNRIQRRLRGQ